MFIFSRRRSQLNRDELDATGHAGFDGDRGLGAVECLGDQDLLRVCLAAGLPVAVYQWVRLDRDVRHMRVVAGYRLDEETGQPIWTLVDPAPEMPLIWETDAEGFADLWECAWDKEGHTRWMCVPYARPSSD